jgi:hypothetical protein
VNGGYLRKVQDKRKSICKVDNLCKLAFSAEDFPEMCSMKTNETIILHVVMPGGTVLNAIPHPYS